MSRDDAPFSIEFEVGDRVEMQVNSQVARAGVIKKIGGKIADRIGRRHTRYLVQFDDGEKRWVAKSRLSYVVTDERIRAATAALRARKLRKILTDEYRDETADD